MLQPVLLALLAGLQSPFAGFHLHPDADVQVSHQDVAGWRIETRRDLFQGHTTCRLQRGAATYENGVITFHFAPGVNTANASFRIDAGAPQSAGSVAVEAAGLGARLHPNKAGNESGGLVAIPARLLSGAGTVLIRPNLKSAHREFNLHDLGSALDAARQKGCDLPLGPPQTS